MVLLKKKVFFTSVDTVASVDLTKTEPANYKCALKVLVWYKAMQEEIDALYLQKTWEFS